MITLTNIINVIITCLFIILVISERNNPKKLPIILWNINCINNFKLCPLKRQSYFFLKGE